MKNAPYYSMIISFLLLLSANFAGGISKTAFNIVIYISVLFAIIGFVIAIIFWQKKRIPFFAAIISFLLFLPPMIPNLIVSVTAFYTVVSLSVIFAIAGWVTTIVFWKKNKLVFNIFIIISNLLLTSAGTLWIGIIRGLEKFQ